jgi:hypothetical protein
VEFINLTPHTLSIQKQDGSFLFLPPSGKVARVATERVQTGTYLGVPVFAVKYGKVIDLPDFQEDQGLIVSGMVQAAMKAVDPHRELLAPGEFIWDSAGVVIGCKGLNL